MTDKTDERLTKVLIDIILETDDVATLNAVRAARRIVEGHGGDAHRLVSLSEDGPSPSNAFAEMNAQDYPPATLDDEGLPREAAASIIHPPPPALAK